jgi:RNA polymerase sigma-70 factor, ECF subfamily
MTERKTESWWVIRAQSGDRVAFEELLKAVQEPLYRYILRLVGERSMAEDIMQEVFIRIYGKLGWLKDPELFRPWAYRIASREAFKHLKRERRLPEQISDQSTLEAMAAFSPEERFEPELIEHLPGLLARVSPASRAVLILHYLHEMPLAEIGAVLGLALGTVKSRLAYGLSVLRREINRQSGVNPVEGRTQKN